MSNLCPRERLTERILQEIEDSRTATAQLAQACSTQILEAATLIIEALRSNFKLIAFGNGGSAVEAQHLVAELVGRYRTDRQPLAAIALTSESASITAIANDYGFEQIFCRQLQAIARPGDVLVAISTSGKSPNVLAALETARALNLKTIALTGGAGGHLRNLVDLCICTPTDCTPRIQEGHLLIVHILCDLVENAFITGSVPRREMTPSEREAR